MKQTVPDFTNKVVSSEFAAADHSLAIHDSRWEMPGGRLYLLGTVPRGGSTRNWCEAVAVGVAWDSVSDYMVFDSVEEYRKRLRIHQGRKRKKSA